MMHGAAAGFTDSKRGHSLSSTSQKLEHQQNLAHGSDIGLTDTQKNLTTVHLPPFIFLLEASPGPPPLMTSHS